MLLRELVVGSRIGDGGVGAEHRQRGKHQKAGGESQGRTHAKKRREAGMLKHATL
ncbi:hypothetical protein SDC9_147582 [bioreactor metagenome]|uniref:Uncharacterized protein n=1 Tax=bioreactor metagenome TaxID=1076179 RepID=A0A645EEF1_9ZZZZ